MRILHVIPAFPPSTGYGGGPSIAYHICRMLVRRGHEVIVFTTDANDESTRLPSRTEWVDGIEIHFFRNISNRAAYRQKLFLAPQMIPSLMQIGGRIDLAHVHDLRTFQAVLVYQFSKNRFPYIVQAHGVVSNLSGGKGILKKLFDRFWGEKIIRNAVGLIALNTNEAEAYSGMGADPGCIAVIPNGIDLSEYRAIPERGHFREKHKLSDHRLILFLGRIHESKRIDFLLKVFATLPEQLRDAVLVIAGPDDGALNPIRQLAADLGLGMRVIFPGYLGGREKLDAFADADVFVTPRFTGFPLTFLESMACGVPILATNQGDIIKEIEGRAGLITSFHQEEFKEALIQILTNTSLHARLSQGAKQLVEQYDWSIIIERFELLYQQIQGSEK